MSVIDFFVLIVSTFTFCVLENKTFWYLLDLLNSLGLNITWSEELLKKCEDILETMMSYKMPMSDFMALMEDIDKYHSAQESKKIEKLLSECCSSSQVVLDSVDYFFQNVKESASGWFSKYGRIRVRFSKYGRIWFEHQGLKSIKYFLLNFFYQSDNTESGSGLFFEGLIRIR